MKENKYIIKNNLNNWLLHNNIFNVITPLVFILFTLISSRFLFANRHFFYSHKISSLLLIAIPCVIVVTFFFNRSMSLFAATPPLLNGLSLTGINANPNLLLIVFSTTSLLWLLLNCVNKHNSIKPISVIDCLLDVFSLFIIVGFFLPAIKYSLLDFINNFINVPIPSQDSEFHPLGGGTIVLYGIIFFRLIRIELSISKNDIFVYRIFIFHTLVMLCFGLIQVFLNIPRINSFGNLSFNYIYSPFDDIHSYGSYSVLLFGYFIAIILSSSSKNKLLDFFICFICFLFILFSYSRITWIAGIVVLSVGFLKRTSRKTIVIVSVLFLCVVIAINYLAHFHSYTYRADENSQVSIYFGRLYDSLNTFNFETNNSGRLQLYYKAWRAFQNNILTGGGIGTFYRNSRDIDGLSGVAHPEIQENAHNYILQLLAETGIMGTSIFITIIGAILYSNIRSRADTSFLHSGKCISLGIVGYLITCQTGHPLLLPSQQFLFWFACAIPSLVQCKNTRK